MGAVTQEEKGDSENSSRLLDRLWWCQHDRRLLLCRLEEDGLLDRELLESLESSE